MLRKTNILLSITIMASVGISAFDGNALINHVFKDGSITKIGCPTIVYGKKEIIAQPFSQDGKLEVHIQVGDITITPSETNEIKVIYQGGGLSEQCLEELKVKFEASTDKAYFISSSNSGKAWVNLEIQVPKNTKLSKIVTHHGNIYIADIANNVWAKSFNIGNIELRNIDGSVKKAKVACGNVHISMHEGSEHSIKAKAIDGSINIEHAGGKVRAHTKKGNVALAMSNAARNSATDIKVSTYKGHIHLNLSKYDQGKLFLTTDIDNFVVSDGSTNAQCSLNQKVQKVMSGGKVNWFEGTIGNGYGNIRASACEGNVNFAVKS